MRNSALAIDTLDCRFDAGDLPLIHVEILVDRLGREERAAAPGVLGQAFEALLGGGINSNGECCCGHIVHKRERLCTFYHGVFFVQARVNSSPAWLEAYIHPTRATKRVDRIRVESDASGIR